MSNPPNHYQPGNYQPQQQQQQFVPQYLSPIPQQQQQQPQNQSNFGTAPTPQSNVAVLSNFRPVYNPMNNGNNNFSVVPHQQQQYQHHHHSTSNNTSNISAVATATLPASTRFAVWLSNLAAKYGHQMNADTVQKLQDNCFDETNFLLLDKESLTEMQFPLGVRLTLLKIIEGENSAKKGNNVHLTDLAHESGQRRQREETNPQQQPNFGNMTNNNNNNTTSHAQTNVETRPESVRAGDRTLIDKNFFAKFPKVRARLPALQAIWTNDNRECIFHGKVNNHTTATCSWAKDLTPEEKAFLKHLYPGVKGVAKLCDPITESGLLPLDAKFLAKRHDFTTRHPQIKGVWHGPSVNCLFHGPSATHHTGACYLFLEFSEEEKQQFTKFYPDTNYDAPAPATVSEVIVDNKSMKL